MDVIGGLLERCRFARFVYGSFFKHSDFLFNSDKKVRLILRLNSGHKQPVDGELIVVYARMRLKVGRRREMKFKTYLEGTKSLR